MGLEEEAIKAALMGTNRLMPGEEGPLLPSPQQLIDQGNLKSYYAGGATQYERPGAGMPLGATSDPSSPRGYTIADPLLREQASRFDVGLASGVAQNQYMDAFERDKLKNTLAIMQASQHLDPEIQQVIMQRLGINLPEQGGGGGAPGPGGNYLGARQTGIGPNGDPIITPMFGDGGANPTGGYQSRKLREELAKLQFEHQLKEPSTQADIELKRLQGQAATATAGANIGYKEALSAGKGDTYKMGLLNAIDNLADKYKGVAGGPGQPGNPVAAETLKRAMDVLMSELQRMTAGAPTGGGGISAPGGVGAEEQATPWWDKGMPSTRAAPTPDPTILKALQARLEHYRRFNPGDIGAQQKIQRQIQELYVNPMVPNSQSGITVRKN